MGISKSRLETGHRGLKLGWPSQIKKGYEKAIKKVRSLFVKENLIMFESFSGRQYSCNPRAIYEYLLKHHPTFEMFWSVDKKCTKQFKDRKIPYVKRFSPKWFFLMGRARYWVTNSRIPLWIFPKPKHTIYVQTWHGTPLKKLASDMDQVHMPYTNSRRYKKNFSLETRNWDYLVSPNQYSTNIFRQAFEFKKPVIESGYPRNDYLYTNNNRETIEQIKKKCGIPLDKKVILYAPTWRDNQFYSIGRYKFDLGFDLRLLQEKFGDDYVMVLRMHYLVEEHFDLTPYEGFAIDLSKYEDIRDLYLISDLLITDYSSVFFDYANLRRPIIFYAYDLDFYRDTLRGFYFDLEKNAPGPVVQTTEGIIEAIKVAERNDFKVSDSFDAFYQRFCYLENGESTRKVVEQVFEKNIPHNINIHRKPAANSSVLSRSV